MIALALALLAASIVSYASIPYLQIHLDYPWPIYALQIAAVAAALRSRARPWVRLPVVALCGGVALLFAGFTGFLTHLERDRLALGPGDPLPAFALPTSTGETFDSQDLRGSSAALFVFYRGDW